jgi:hypothetical protein
MSGSPEEVRRHDVGGGAHQHEPAVVPASAVDPLHRMDGEILEALDAGEQGCRRRIGRRPGARSAATSRAASVQPKFLLCSLTFPGKPCDPTMIPRAVPDAKPPVQFAISRVT